MSSGGRRPAHRADNDRGRVWTTTEAEMRAYDQLPRTLRDFVKTANRQWACVPMLRRAKKCGVPGRWTMGRLLDTYRQEDEVAA